MRNLRAILAVVTTLASAAAALAGEITIPLADGTDVEKIETVYDCGDRTVAVTYINAGAISLAVLDMDGEPVVAANVISASGARYAGAHYVWWSKGDEASLYDLMQGGEDAPTASCTAR